MCNENEDDRGTVWPETIAGNTLFKSCNETFTGRNYKLCRVYSSFGPITYMMSGNVKIASKSFILNNLFEQTLKIIYYHCVTFLYTKATNPFLSWDHNPQIIKQ